jgi:hypothetical protein
MTASTATTETLIIQEFLQGLGLMFCRQFVLQAASLGKKCSIQHACKRRRLMFRACSRARATESGGNCGGSSLGLSITRG